MISGWRYRAVMLVPGVLARRLPMPWRLGMRSWVFQPRRRRNMTLREMLNRPRVVPAWWSFLGAFCMGLTLARGVIWIVETTL